MPDLFMRKTQTGKLEPADSLADAYLKKIGAGSIVRAKITKPRNVEFHRKFFALLQLAFDNQDKYDNFEAFRKEIVMRAGWFTEHHHLTGAISYEAKSVSFGSMDELEFGELYAACVRVICKYVIPGMDAEALKAEVDERLRGFGD